MAERYFRMSFGMKQHPQNFIQRGYPAELKEGQEYPGGYKNPKDFQMLFSGDVFACEEALLERPKSAGGWQDRKVTTDSDGVETEHWIMDIAVKLPEDYDDGEQFVLRPEPSQIIGVNISEKEFVRRQSAEDAESHAVRPKLPVAVGTPDTIRKPAGTPSAAPKAKVPAGAGPARVSRS